jgi:hypothetical protein
MSEHDRQKKYDGLGSIAVDCFDVDTDFGLVHVDTYDREEALWLQAMDGSVSDKSETNAHARKNS